MNSEQPTSAQKAVNYLLLWKVAIVKLIIRCAIIGVTFYLGAMANTHWEDLDGDSRFKLALGIAVNMLTLLSTFLDKAEKSLATGDLIPPDDGNTTIIQRKTTQVDTVQTTSGAAAAAPLGVPPLGGSGPNPKIPPEGGTPN